MIRSAEQAKAEALEHAEMLEDIATRIRSGTQIPTGTFVQVYRQDGTVLRVRHIEAGFDLLRAVGIFESMKADIVDEIRGLR